MFGQDGIHGELDVMLRPILQGMLGYVGLRVLTPFVAFHVPYLSQETRQQILLDYRDHLSNLDRLPALTFPSPEDLDERLSPVKKESGSLRHTGT